MRLWKRIQRWFRQHRADRIRFDGTLGMWWQKPTLMLGTLPELEPAHDLAVREAAEWWNAKCPGLFTVVRASADDHAAVLGFPVRGMVGVVTEPPLREHHNAHTEVFWEDAGRKQILGAHVRIRQGLRGEKLTRAVVHELGHVLGLKHPVGNDARYLMDVDGTGFRLLPEELEHVKMSRSRWYEHSVIFWD